MCEFLLISADFAHFDTEISKIFMFFKNGFMVFFSKITPIKVFLCITTLNNRYFGKNRQNIKQFVAKSVRIRFLKIKRHFTIKRHFV